MTTPTPPGAIVGAATQQFLTFRVANEEYGIGILKVQEIRGWSAVTAIPHSAPCVLGVIDLRGVVVPVLDLRRRFDLDPVAVGPSTVVIVIRVAADGPERTIGLVVDAVSDVYDIGENAFRAVPDLGSTPASDVVVGLASVDGKTLILLDSDRLVATTVRH